MKKLLAVMLTLAMICSLCAGSAPAFADGPGQSSKGGAKTAEAPAAAEEAMEFAYIPGHWGKLEYIRNGQNNPFYLDYTVKNATWIDFFLTAPCPYRGDPCGNWYLYAMDEKGSWDPIAAFPMVEGMIQGNTVRLHLELDFPSNFKALTITAADSGMDFTLWRFIDFYTDPQFLPVEARGAVPEDLFDQFEAYRDKQPPLTEQSRSSGKFNYPGYSGGYFWVTPGGGPGGSSITGITGGKTEYEDTDLNYVLLPGDDPVKKDSYEDTDLNYIMLPGGDPDDKDGDLNFIKITGGGSDDKDDDKTGGSAGGGYYWPTPGGGDGGKVGDSGGGSDDYGDNSWYDGSSDDGGTPSGRYPGRIPDAGYSPDGNIYWWVEDDGSIGFTSVGGDDSGGGYSAWSSDGSLVYSEVN